ncbi:MAG TPA: hypothetical protein VHW23_35740 [Kofleriaceae bacterium]|jgi:hypothetical protein|nr:hypothetical protein [Kofleriaceae bacterium]
MRRIVQLAAASAVALAALGVGVRVAADEPPPRIDVAVGETVERDVGFAVGLLCDDLSIVHAELRSETPESNVLRITGVTPGDTQCRAGTVPGRPVFVFEIHCHARHSAPP